MKFLKMKTKKFNFKKVSVLVSIFSVLFFALLSFSINIFTSSCEEIIPEGDPIYIDGNKKYYTNCYTENDMNVSASPSLEYVYDLSDDHSLKGYYYSDGLLVLDGEGDVGIISGNFYKTKYSSSNVTKIVVSNNGFKPHGQIGSLFSSSASLVTVDLDGFDTTYVTGASALFNNCRELTTINFGDDFILEGSIAINQMFMECSKLTSVDMSNFKTNVTSLLSTFKNCSSLQSITFGDDMTFSVDQLFETFYGCKALKSIDLSSLNTSNLNSLYCAFYQCESLKSIDLSCLNTSNVSDMGWMLSGCTSLENINFGETFDVKKVTSMSSMLYNIKVKNLDLSCFVFDSPSKLTSANNFLYDTSLLTLNLEGCDFSKCSSSDLIFQSDGTANLSLIILPKAINSYGLKLPDYEGTKAYMKYDYNNHLLNNDTYGNPCSTNKGNILSSSEISGKVGRNDGKLYKLVKQETLLYEDETTGTKYYRTGLLWYGSWNRSAYQAVDLSLRGDNVVTGYIYFPAAVLILDGEGDFNGGLYNNPFNTYNSSITKVIVSNNGFKITNDASLASKASLSNLFKGLTALKTVDLERFDSSNVTSLESLFHGCSSLKSVKFGSTFDTSKVTSLKNMFNSCTLLEDIDFGPKFDTSNVTTMNSMFEGCESIKDIDLSSFTTSTDLTDMYNFIHFCKSLISVTLGNGFNTTSVTTYGNSFVSCDNLSILDLTGLDSSTITDRWSHYQINQLTKLKLINTPQTLPEDTSGVMTSEILNLPKGDIDGIWLGYKNGSLLPDTFTKLVTKDVCDTLIYIPSSDIEKQMMDYLILDSYIKEELNTYPEYRTYINDLNTKYYALMNSKNCDTKKDITNKDENLEIFGVVNNTKDTPQDHIEVKVSKIVNQDEIKDIKEDINKSSTPLQSNEGILVPYDIKLFCNSEEIHETKDKLIVKLELPMDYYLGLLNVFRNHDGVISKLSDEPDASGERELWKEVLNINGTTKFNLYFMTDRFSTYTLTTNVTSVVISSDYGDKVNTSENYVSSNAIIPFDSDGKAEVKVKLNPSKTKAEVYKGSELIKTLTGANNTFLVTKDEINPEENIYLTVKFIDISKPDNGGNGGGNSTGGSITTSSITIQVSDHKPYIDGYKDGTFKANRNMTRAEFAKIICELSQNYSMNNKDELKNELDKYNDINKNAWYSNYARYMIKTGLMKGYKDSFRPNDNITRAEVCKVLNDMYGIGNKVSNASSNTSSNKYTNELKGHWYENSITNLIKGNYIVGYPDGTIKPEKNITRAEIVSLVNRVINREVKKDISDGYNNLMINKFKDVSKSSWYYNDLLEASIAHNSFDLH